MLILNLNVDGQTNVNNLEKAIDNLEEKKNESLSNDANDFFFLSKDVARILLANICMYQGEYSQAEKLLGKVISNGFYGLDASNYNNKETITNLFNNGSSKETIFATHNEPQSRGNISIGIPLLVPIMTYYELYPSIYETIPEKRTPQPRGKNTLIDCFSRIRTFFLWCFDNKLTANRPFDKFPIEECKYGTPIYINLEERDRIFNADLSATPQLEIQRDIFIFQTLIGCRVSDLYRMTKLNIVNGAVEYIQKKTKEGNPVTVRVPLNDKAKEILERYKDHEGKLLPFISEQKYNEAIKKIFKLSGVDRIVTILDPLTRDEVKKPLYEVASSHLARRTFIGNIYKKVKDPNLVSALSGHKEGSKAFRRYRDIDEEMKKDLVKLLD